MFVNIEKCSIAYDGLLNSNAISSLKGMVNTLNSLIEEWKVKRMDPVNYGKFLETRTLIPVMMDFGNYLDTYYYLGAVQVSAVLLERLEADVKFIKTWNPYSYPIFILLFSGLTLTAIIQNQKLTVAFTKSIFVFPFELIEKNTVLKSYILKVTSKTGKLH